MRYAVGAAGDWLSGRALRSHRRGHWFDPSIAHTARRPVPFWGTGLLDLPPAGRGRVGRAPRAPGPDGQPPAPAVMCCGGRTTVVPLVRDVAAARTSGIMTVGQVPPAIAWHAISPVITFFRCMTRECRKSRRISCWHQIADMSSFCNTALGVPGSNSGTTSYHAARRCAPGQTSPNLTSLPQVPMA
jgi:hypothetical protein